MTEQCRTWFCPIDFILPLCANRFQPVEKNRSCPLCAVPKYSPENVCGCEDGQVDGARLYLLHVLPGPLGQKSDLSAFYGDWNLTNRAANSTDFACESVAIVPSYGGTFPVFGGQWMVEGIGEPYLVGSVWYRDASLQLQQTSTSFVQAWEIDRVPACSNHSSYSSGAVNVAGYDDWFEITVESL